MRFLILLIALAGCSHNSLKQGAQRVYVGDRVYLFADSEQVDRHCSKGATFFDNGLPVGTPGYRIKCCTEYRPNSKWKFRIWVPYDGAECLAHEECHIKIWQGQVEGPHSNCHDFGVNSGRRRL